MSIIGAFKTIGWLFSVWTDLENKRLNRKRWERDKNYKTVYSLLPQETKVFIDDFCPYKIGERLEITEKRKWHDKKKTGTVIDIFAFQKGNEKDIKNNWNNMAYNVVQHDPRYDVKPTKIENHKPKFVIVVQYDLTWYDSCDVIDKFYSDFFGYSTENKTYKDVKKI